MAATIITIHKLIRRIRRHLLKDQINCNIIRMVARPHVGSDGNFHFPPSDHIKANTFNKIFFITLVLGDTGVRWKAMRMLWHLAADFDFCITDGAAVWLLYG